MYSGVLNHSGFYNPSSLSSVGHPRSTNVWLRVSACISVSCWRKPLFDECSTMLSGVLSSTQLSVPGIQAALDSGSLSRCGPKLDWSLFGHSQSSEPPLPQHVSQAGHVWTEGFSVVCRHLFKTAFYMVVLHEYVSNS